MLQTARVCVYTIETTKKAMDQHQLTSTFLRLRAGLGRCAARMLGDDDAADDALQDAFFRLWQRRDAIKTEKDAAGLSVTAVRHVALDMLRRRKVRIAVSMDEAGDIAASDDVDDREELYARIKSIIDKHLSPRQQAVLRMHDIEGMAYCNIAEEIGTTQENVRMILSRARKTIREIYKNTGYE